MRRKQGTPRIKPRLKTRRRALPKQSDRVLPTPGRTPNLSQRSQSARAKALHVLSDLRRDPKLTLTQAAKNREVSLRSVRKYTDPHLKQDRPGGRIRVTASDRLRSTLFIPSTKPGVLIPVKTKNSKERYLVGEWFAAIKEAGRGDFTRLNEFPKGTFVGGVRLATGPFEVQRILEAMEKSEQPFENLYAMAGAA